MKKSLLSLLLALVMLFNISVSAYATSFSDMAEKGKKNQKEMMEKWKERQGKVGLKPIPALENIPFLHPIPDYFKVWLDIVKDLKKDVYQVPFEIFSTDDPDEQINQLIDNINKGVLNYAKVTVDDASIRYTFFNKTTIMIDKKEYEVGEIIVYDKNYGMDSFKSDTISLGNEDLYHKYFSNIFSTKTETSSPIPTEVKIKLSPVNDSQGKPVTKDFNLYLDFDNASKIKFVQPNDMKESNWAFVPVVYNMTVGNFKGNGKGEFMPKSPISRGQFATVMGRVGGVDVNQYSDNDFTDVKNNMYYAPYTNWVKEKELYYLQDETKFEPDKAVTREEMAYMLYEFIKMKGIELEDVDFKGFEDEGEISDWAKESVMFLAKKGIIKGYDGKFHPKDTFTRAQVAQILYNLRELV